MAAAPAVVPGPVFQRMLRVMGPDVEELLGTVDGLVAACAGGSTLCGCGWDQNLHHEQTTAPVISAGAKTAPAAWPCFGAHTANMTAPAAGAGLRTQRAAVESAAAAAETARVRLHLRYLEEQPGALAEAGGHSAGDFACQAWLHAALLAVDEVSTRLAGCKALALLRTATTCHRRNHCPSADTADAGHRAPVAAGAGPGPGRAAWLRQGVAWAAADVCLTACAPGHASACSLSVIFAR